MFAAEKAAIGGKRGGVRCGENEVFGGVDELDFGLCVGAPQKEDEAGAFLRKLRDGGIGKDFPAAALVRTRLMRAHRERSVQKKHSLPRPVLQIAVLRRWNADIVLQFLENVHE